MVLALSKKGKDIPLGGGGDALNDIEFDDTMEASTTSCLGTTSQEVPNGEGPEEVDLDNLDLDDDVVLSKEEQNRHMPGATLGGLKKEESKVVDLEEGWSDDEEEETAAQKDKRAPTEGTQSSVGMESAPDLIVEYENEGGDRTGASSMLFTPSILSRPNSSRSENGGRAPGRIKHHNHSTPPPPATRGGVTIPIPDSHSTLAPVAPAATPNGKKNRYRTFGHILNVCGVAGCAMVTYTLIVSTSISGENQRVMASSLSTSTTTSGCDFFIGAFWRGIILDFFIVQPVAMLIVLGYTWLTRDDGDDGNTEKGSEEGEEEEEEEDNEEASTETGLGRNEDVPSSSASQRGVTLQTEPRKEEDQKKKKKKKKEEGVKTGAGGGSTRCNRNEILHPE